MNNSDSTDYLDNLLVGKNKMKTAAIILTTLLTRIVSVVTGGSIFIAIVGVDNL